MIGFPDGIAELLTPWVKRRMVVSLFGSTLIALLDMLGVLAMLPLMQLIAGTPRESGALGFLVRSFGDPENKVLVGILAAFIVTAFVLKGVVSIVFRAWQLRFMADQESATSTRILRGYLLGPYAWHLTRNTGDKIWTVDAAVGLGFSAGIGAALALATEIFTIVLIFVGLIIATPFAALFALLYFGISGAVLQHLVRSRVRAAAERNQDAGRRTAKASLQALGAVKEIKLRNAEEKFVVDYRTARHEAAHAGATAALLNELPKYLLEIVFIVGIALLAIGVTASSSSQEGIVILGLFVAAGSRILPSTVRLIAAIGAIRFSRPPLEHLIAEVRMQDEAEREQVSRVSTDAIPSGPIQVRELTFAYADRPDELVLRGVEADIPVGKSMAIVGSSGAGKSTFVDTLLGLHTPTGGLIAAGGVDIFTNLPAWQRRLAVVPQEVYLLDDTLKANIAFDLAPDDGRLSDVVERAQLSDLISGLPDGLDTEVGERGARLSGGQRQRIGIARALYRNPEVLVLDEATSALDNETERRLTQTIEKLRGSVTMIIVAHRLSTVRHCDQLLFMSHGRVVSRGTFEEVSASNEEFAHLVQLGALVGERGGGPDL